MRAPWASFTLTAFRNKTYSEMVIGKQEIRKPGRNTVWRGRG
jgi:hypothetical protein